MTCKKHRYKLIYVGSRIYGFQCVNCDNNVGMLKREFKESMLRVR